jgi:glyoxylase-like metal-dependent hydrolase (beta-lactamase superfamily II)
MRSVRTTVLLSVILFAASWPAGTLAQNTGAVLDAAATALGTAPLTSIQVSGRGSDYVVGQPYDERSPWPRFNMPSFTMAIDYTTPAMRTERTREQGEDPPRGGALQPRVGQQRLIQFVSGRLAWNQTGETATPAGTGGAVRGESPGVGLHTPTAVEERLLQIWLTPHGFIRAAREFKATTRTEAIRGARTTTIKFTTPIGLTLEGFLNEQQLLDRIESWMAHPVLGDTRIEATFTGYKDFGGTRFPSQIVYRLGAYPAFDLTVTGVTPNAPVKIEVPNTITKAAATAAPTAAVEAQKMSDGIWLFPGGSQSLAVEFSDHVVMIDAPVDEERSRAVIAALKRVVPKKPIRFIVNTHMHFDHVGGLREYAAEGATIVTEQANIPYYQQIWAAPRTISPDRLTKSGRRISYEAVIGSRTFKDDTRELVLYHYPGNMHNSGMLMAFLPRERILFEADSFIPGRPGVAHPAIPNLIHFYDAVRRLQIDVVQIVPSHGRVTTFDDLRETAERSRGASR